MGECLILKSGGGTDTSDATATKEVILSGYTAYVNDVKITGTMVDRGSVSKTLNCGESYTIEEGYYKDGTISVNSLASQTDANGVAAYVLTGYKGWAKGALVTGSMANRGGVSVTLAVNGSYTIPSGWHSGSGTVSQSLTTQPGTTITPGTGSKTAVASGKWVTGTVWCKGDANLLASNIKKGVSMFGVTGTWQGY